jgi:hypothetical protein
MVFGPARWYLLARSGSGNDGFRGSRSVGAPCRLSMEEPATRLATKTWAEVE